MASLVVPVTAPVASSAGSHSQEAKGDRSARCARARLQLHVAARARAVVRLPEAQAHLETHLAHPVEAVAVNTPPVLAPPPLLLAVVPPETPQPQQPQRGQLVTGSSEASPAAADASAQAPHSAQYLAGRSWRAW